MRWGNNENETSKNQMQMLPCKIHIRVKPDKYINTFFDTSYDGLLHLISSAQLILHE